MEPPLKPFPGYKWQWATVTCTEGLNDPKVFLGVLRALKQYEGKSPNDPDLYRALQRVEAESESTVKLARTIAERNLIRNSGQYWKALDLLSPDAHGEVSLTSFGRSVADGNITPVEFATTVVHTLELPNPKIDRRFREWGELRIKPLELILQILAELNRSLGATEAYVTPLELTRIVIPLAGENSPVAKHVMAIMLNREGKLDLILTLHFKNIIEPIGRRFGRQRDHHENV